MSVYFAAHYNILDRSRIDRLFKALSDGGEVEMSLQEMFWGGYFGTLVDWFGINRMFNCASKTYNDGC